MKSSKFNKSKQRFLKINLWQKEQMKQKKMMKKSRRQSQ